MKVDPERDFVRLGEDFFIGFLYGDVTDESEFLRSSRSVWLEIKSDNVEEMTRKILDFGVRKLDISNPHLYFRRQRDKSCGWLESTRTSHFMREQEKVRMWQRYKEALKKEARRLAKNIAVVALSAGMLSRQPGCLDEADGRYFAARRSNSLQNEQSAASPPRDAWHWPRPIRIT